MTKKTCTHCKKEKKISQFYGSNKLCIKCTLRQRKWRASSSGKASTLKYNKTEKAKKSRKRFEVSPKGKANLKKYAASEKGIATHKRYRDRHPEKLKAHDAIGKAVRNGTIDRPEICKLNDDTCSGRLEYHHPNYEKPFDVVCLCKHHHAAQHHGGVDLLLLNELYECVIDLESEGLTTAQASKLTECYELIRKLQGE